MNLLDEYQICQAYLYPIHDVKGDPGLDNGEPALGHARYP
jgi:hypothetical protein